MKVRKIKVELLKLHSENTLGKYCPKSKILTPSKFQTTYTILFWASRDTIVIQHRYTRDTSVIQSHFVHRLHVPPHSINTSCTNRTTPPCLFYCYIVKNFQEMQVRKVKVESSKLHSDNTLGKSCPKSKIQKDTLNNSFAICSIS